MDTGKINSYLVFILDADGTEWASIMTSYKIFDRMDMNDCSGEQITSIYLLRPGKKKRLIECEFNGTWHNLRDPLLMTITDNKGRVLDSDYGTDH